MQRPFPHRNWSGAHWGVPAIGEEKSSTSQLTDGTIVMVKKRIQNIFQDLLQTFHVSTNTLLPLPLNSAHLAVLTALHTFMLIWRSANSLPVWVHCCFTVKFFWLVSLRMTGRTWLSSLWFQNPQSYSACAKEKSVPHFNNLSHQHSYGSWACLGRSILSSPSCTLMDLEWDLHASLKSELRQQDFTWPTCFNFCCWQGDCTEFL